MSILLLIVGFTIVAVALYDILITVLSPNGSGFLTGRLSHYIWRSALFLSGKNGKSKILAVLGVFLVLFIVLNWVMVIWLANTLIIYSHDNAILNENGSGYVTDFVSKFYFVGYVLSAMGNGDYLPATSWWKIYTSCLSFTGVIFISLAVSYLIPIIQAVTHKRSFALRVSTLGRSPQEVLVRNYKNDQFKYLINQLYQLKSELIDLAQEHLAYPVIHYFHSTKQYESTSLSIAILDETISILTCVMDKETRESEFGAMLEDLQTSMTYLLNTLKSGYIDPYDDDPSVPDLNYFHQHNIPKHVNISEIRGYFQTQKERRKLLLAYVQNDSWTWDDVTNGQSRIEIES